ncbi:hypothetical protein Lesp02_68240 [Lentzea sp. NBRC 105346]|uniref:hypothetical protein n=1 Tax=Lentzea sp. NBRC 105346 TaxID=3032205 RepID=UPI0024A3AB2E|nr:hypothetical protein [Lentzea sp. NBRC 105346]GLZ34637.1 hypothetical protein Lesp02_68240 [Lentzea sp. NBRC 105346]
MSNNFDAVVHEVLVEGLDDWVPIDRVIGSAWEVAQRSGGVPVETASTIIRLLVEGGQMVPGVIEANGFEAWRGSPSELATRIIQQCEELNWEPFGAGCWLANTQDGDVSARDGLPQ